MDDGNPVQDPTQSPPETAPAQPDPIATLLAEIKDESGRQKYTDAETAIKALKASQEYIPQLKTEISSWKERAELQNDVKTVQELLMSTDESTPAPIQEPVVTAPTSTEQPQVTATESSMEEQFEAFLAKKTAAEREVNNLSAVQSKLDSLYGEKKQEVYAAKAQELGVNPEFLDSMAKTSPNAVLEYFKTATAVPSARSTINTSGMQPAAAQAPPNVMLGSTASTIKTAWDMCHPDAFRS